MATAKKVTQKPILETDETVSEAVPAEQIVEAVKTPKKSRRRTSIDEYAAVTNMRPEVKAGFKAWLKTELFHFDNEWDELLKKYQSRTL